MSTRACDPAESVRSQLVEALYGLCRRPKHEGLPRGGISEAKGLVRPGLFPSSAAKAGWPRP